LRVLFTGRGTSGSWQCRGVQLGGSVGDYKPKATLQDMQGYDLIVLVKRPATGQIEAIRQSGKPWAWDVVDFYPQPACTGWGKDKSIGWVRSQIESFKPNGVIWPNAKMAEDCGTAVPDCVIYHHYRPDTHPARIADIVRMVGYEGSPAYLGRWGHAIRKECKRRGWRFSERCRPQDADICVAFRDKKYDGYAQRHWKSNVKLANCHGAGVPFLGASENGYLETQAGGEVFCDDIGRLSECMDMLTPKAARDAVSSKFLAHKYPLEAAAKDLWAFLSAM
jgi:hypothetical protein